MKKTSEKKKTQALFKNIKKKNSIKIKNVRHA